MTLKEFIIKITGCPKNPYEDDKILILMPLLGIFLIIFVGINLFGHFLTTTVTGAVVTVKEREVLPLGFGIVTILIIVMLSIYVIRRNRKES